MSEAWIAALSALATGLLSLLGVYVANRKSSALIGYRLEQLEKKMEKLEGIDKKVDRIESLEKKVDIHNRVVERVYKLEGEMTEAQHDIRDIKARKEG